MHKITCLDAQDNPIEVDKNNLTWRPSVYGIVIKDNSILLLPVHKDGFDFPGGAIEIGETIEEALIREVQEETGLTIDVGELITVRESFFYSVNKTSHHTHLFYYSCYNPRGELSIKGFHEHEKDFAEIARWVPLSEIDNLTFYNGIYDSAALIKTVKSKSN